MEFRIKNGWSVQQACPIPTRITPKNKKYKTPTPSPHKYRFFIFFFPHKNPPTKQAITLITIKPIFSTEAERLPFNMANANTAKNSIVSNTAIMQKETGLLHAPSIFYILAVS